MRVLVTSRPGAYHIAYLSNGIEFDLCISIRSSNDGTVPRGAEDAVTPLLSKVATVVLPLYFDDFIPLRTPQDSNPNEFMGMNRVPFNDDQALSIIKVVAEASSVLIHCDAGWSRSVAIGAFLRDFYGANVEFQISGDDSQRNEHVYGVMFRARRNLIRQSMRDEKYGTKR